MFIKLHHVGIVSKSLEEDRQLYCSALGLPAGAIYDLPSEEVRIMEVPVGEEGIGESPSDWHRVYQSSHLEINQPTVPGSGIARYMEKWGEGLHHLAIETDSIEEDVERLKQQGLQLIGPISGSKGIKVAWFHPKSARGVLIELWQNPK
ncbi:MAG: VOC family protein [Dehalococcoidia bacterium]